MIHSLSPAAREALRWIAECPAVTTHGQARSHIVDRWSSEVFREVAAALLSLMAEQAEARAKARIARQTAETNA